MADDVDGQLVDRQVAWAHTYDGYQRLAGGDAGPAALKLLLHPAIEEWRRTGHVPDWCGVDLLRGWAFYLARADHHGRGYGLVADSDALQEWNAVLARIAAHPAGRPEERPPVHVARPAPSAVAVLSTEPRMHRDAGFLLAKQSRWFEPHIAPVNALVQEIARTVRGDVPYVDPDCGGVNARVLLLLEAPAGAAAHGSHMLSADNDDGTAANVWRAYDDTELPRAWAVHWNAVPWYIGVPGKIRAATAADVAEGRRWLIRLVDILPDLRVLLTLGNRARDAVTPVKDTLERRSVAVLDAPHPSQRLYNSTRGGARDKVHAAFKDAVRLCGGD